MIQFFITVFFTDFRLVAPATQLASSIESAQRSASASDSSLDTRRTDSDVSAASFPKSTSGSSLNSSLGKRSSGDTFASESPRPLKVAKFAEDDDNPFLDRLGALAPPLKVSDPDLPFYIVGAPC